MTDSASNTSARRIVFFDGDCGFCNRQVQFLLRHDRSQRLQFAPLQGETAMRSLPESLRSELSSIVYLENQSIYTKSEAVRKICGQLGGVWRLAELCRIIPRSIRDRLYDVVARNRYRLRGKDVCSLEASGAEHRMLP